MKPSTSSKQSASASQLWVPSEHSSIINCAVVVVVVVVVVDVVVAVVVAASSSTALAGAAGADGPDETEPVP